MELLTEQGGGQKGKVGPSGCSGNGRFHALVGERYSIYLSARVYGFISAKISSS